MMISEHTMTPLIVVALVVLTLVTSGFARRYQQRQAARRSVVKRMETGLVEVEGLLEDLKALPLDQGLRRLLHEDVCARYQVIQGVFPAYPNLQTRIKDAQLRRDAVANSGLSDTPELVDEGAIAALLARLDALVELIANAQLMTPLVATVRQAHTRHLGEVRAELLSGYHLGSAREKRQADDLEGAGKHLLALIETLKTRGPNTELVLGLYNAAEEAYEALSGGDEDAADESALADDEKQAS